MKQLDIGMKAANPLIRAAAIALALLGGAKVGMAQIVTIPWSAKYQSAVQIRSLPEADTCESVYTVPTNRKLRITTAVLDSFGSASPVLYQYLCTGTGTTCDTYASGYFTAPVGTSLAMNFTSSIMLNPGQTLFICNIGSHQTSWFLTGFLYT